GGQSGTKPDAPAKPDPKAAAQAPSAAEPMTHPIWDRVSHAVLYNFKDIENPEPSRFEIINNSHIASFAAGGGGAAATGGEGRSGRLGGEGPAGGGGGGGASTRTWQPLQGTGGGSRVAGGGRLGAEGGRMGGEGGRMGGEGRAAAMAQAMSRRGAAVQPGAVAASQPAAASTEAASPSKKKDHVRTEFVIFFVWKEPIPSDELLGTPVEAGPAGGGPAGAGGFGVPAGR